MAAENSGCDFVCKLRKLANSIFHPGENVNTNTGRLSSRYSNGTGWKLDRKNTKNNPTSKREPQQLVNSLQIQEIMKSQTDIQTNEIILPRKTTNTNTIKIGGKEIDITGPTDISFEFADIGGIRHNHDGKRIIGATNRINPLNQDTELNLRAISRFLITNPEARIRFQNPTIPKSQHPNVQSDMKSIYDMSFSQITNHLRTQGVENLNQRVLRSSGSDFNVFLDD